MGLTKLEAKFLCGLSYEKFPIMRLEGEYIGVLKLEECYETQSIELVCKKIKITKDTIQADFFEKNKRIVPENALFKEELYVSDYVTEGYFKDLKIGMGFKFCPDGETFVKIEPIYSDSDTLKYNARILETGELTLIWTDVSLYGKESSFGFAFEIDEENW